MDGEQQDDLDRQHNRRNPRDARQTAQVEQAHTGEGQSELTEVMRKLHSVLNRLDSVLTEQPKGSNDGWDILHKASTSYDTEKLDRWTKEMDNLLVFAGLFSAVVTTFITGSLQSLSSSSTQPPPSDSTSVKANDLWILSLVLSLVIAFFAIAFQQWLRAYCLPSGLSPRDAVLLRHSRYEALHYWRFSEFITVLAVLLQAAVVMFLVGIWEELHAYNHPVSTAYAVLSLGPFLLYTATIVLPLFVPSCPYKSPLLPAVYFLSVATVIIGAVIAGIVFAILTMMALTPWVLLLGIEHVAFAFLEGRRKIWASLVEVMSHFVKTYLYELTSALIRRLPVPTRKEDMWTDREITRQSQLDHDQTLRASARALAWAPYAVQFHELHSIWPCTNILSPAHQGNCILVWATLYLGNRRITSSDINFPIPPLRYYWWHMVVSSAWTRFQRTLWVPIRPSLLVRVNPAFSQIFRPHLLETLRRAMDSDEAGRCLNIPSIAGVTILLSQMVVSNKDDDQLRRELLPLLFKLCQTHPLASDREPSPNRSDDCSYVAAVCLFRCVRALPVPWTQPVLSGQEIYHLFTMFDACQPPTPHDEYEAPEYVATLESFDKYNAGHTTELQLAASLVIAVLKAEWKAFLGSWSATGTTSGPDAVRKVAMRVWHRSLEVACAELRSARERVRNATALESARTGMAAQAALGLETVHTVLHSLAPSRPRPAYPVYEVEHSLSLAATALLALTQNQENLDREDVRQQKLPHLLRSLGEFIHRRRLWIRITSSLLAYGIGENVIVSPAAIHLIATCLLELYDHLSADGKYCAQEVAKQLELVCRDIGTLQDALPDLENIRGRTAEAQEGFTGGSGEESGFEGGTRAGFGDWGGLASLSENQLPV